jgi:hypothetical protein
MKLCSSRLFYLKSYCQWNLCLIFFNDLEWRNSQNESCRSQKIMKLCNWQLLIWIHLKPQKSYLHLVYYNMRGMKIGYGCIWVHGAVVRKAHARGEVAGSNPVSRVVPRLKTGMGGWVADGVSLKRFLIFIPTFSGRCIFSLPRDVFSSRQTFGEIWALGKEFIVRVLPRVNRSFPSVSGIRQTHGFA